MIQQKKPSVLILRTAGTNCDHETQAAYLSQGCPADRIHLNRVLEKPSILKKYQILVFPGGFSYGDYISAGKVMANQILFRIRDELLKFTAERKLIIGICNGFQVLVKLGLLPFFDSKPEQTVTLTSNTGGSFVCQWAGLHVNPSTIFTRDMPHRISLPVAHAEGRFFTYEPVLKRIEESNMIAFRYTNNFNGSLNDIAGIVDESGHILGMMPHPERYMKKNQYPYSSGDLHPPAGAMIIRNSVKYFF